ncbi:MAG: IS110 family transposase [Methylococcales bacterium]
MTKPGSRPSFNGFKRSIYRQITADLSGGCPGSYSLPLADFLVVQGYPVSLVNPAKIHAFAKSELSRAKTDKADAAN